MTSSTRRSVRIGDNRRRPKPVGLVVTETGRDDGKDGRGDADNPRKSDTMRCAAAAALRGTRLSGQTNRMLRPAHAAESRRLSLCVAVAMLVSLTSTVLAGAVVDSYDEDGSTLQDNKNLHFAEGKRRYHNSRKLQRRQQQQEEVDDDDGTLNGFSLFRSTRRQSTKMTKVRDMMYSNVHCVGENFDTNPKTSPYRSCKFKNLCLFANAVRGNSGAKDAKSDDDGIEFRFYQSREEVALEEMLLSQQQHVPIAGQATISSLASIVGRYGEVFQFPMSIVPHEYHHGGDNDDYYYLDESVIMVVLPPPRTDLAGLASSPPPSFRWWLSLYNLLAIFGYDNEISSNKKKQRIMLVMLPSQTKSNVDDGSAASVRHSDDYIKLFFLKAMGMKEQHVVTSSHDFTFDFTGKLQQERGGDGTDHPVLVCSKHAVTTFGLVSEFQDDPEATYKVGQGATLWAFRNHMASNLSGAGVRLRVPTAPPFKVIFASSSSGSVLSKQLDVVKQGFGAQEIAIEHLVEKVDAVDSNRAAGDLEALVHRVSESAIFVAAMNSENPQLTVMLTAFLPRGATLILYSATCDDTEQQQKDIMELLNTAGYFQMHCFDLKSKDTKESLTKVKRIIRDKIDLIRIREETTLPS